MNNLMMTNSNTNEPTMSSREIQVVIGSRHDTVKLTIERLADRGLITFTPMVKPTPGGGKPTTVYHVNQRDSYVVVARISPEFTTELVDRWQELEAQTAQPKLPQSFAEALRLAADTQEQLEAESQQRQLAEKRRDSLQVTVGTHRHSISRFARTFTDVNSMKTKTDLFALGYLYRQGGAYRVYRKFSGLFEEKIEEFTGRTEIYPTESGKVLISDLRADGFLTLLKRFQH